MFDVIAPRIEAQQLTGLDPLRLQRWDGTCSPLETLARVGHDGKHLHIAFRAQHRGLAVDVTLPREEPAPRLWEHDVVEVFLHDRQTAPSYREIEVSPLGQWLTLAFDDVRSLSSTRFSPPLAITVEHHLDSFGVTFSVALESLFPGSNRHHWSIGLFRIEGREPRREYLSLTTMPGAVPDFHQPEQWPRLRFGG